MLKKNLIIIFLLIIINNAFSQSYIKQQQQSLTVGNSFYEMFFDLSNKRVKAVWFLNKVSQTRYFLSGDMFSVEVSYLGEDVTPPTPTPSIWNCNDFTFHGVQVNSMNTEKEFRFSFTGQGLEIGLNYIIDAKSPVLRVALEIKETWGRPSFLESVSPFHLRFVGMQPELGGFGQPVYSRDMFFGVEFPAAFTAIERDGSIRTWHRSGENLSSENYYRSHDVILGCTMDGKVQKDFFSYIESRRPRPTEPFALYNTWYDIREFSIEKLFDTADNFKKTLIDSYGLKLDAFVIDDGWDDLNSVWEINKQRFPEGFTPLARKLKDMNSRMGLWISPWNGYDISVQKRVAWAAQQGYETSGTHLCLGGEKYYKQFLTKTLQHLKDANLSFYKIDGFLSLCNETTHDHLPGINSQEFLTRRFIEILKAIRREKPDIFIDITVGTWLSPWWLLYADAVWMTGADFGHAEDVPAFSERDKAITFRDYTLYKDFVRDRLQFPLANVMTHGIIKGKLNMLGGTDETLRNWKNNTVMYFSRGVMMWELYLSPEVLSVEEWDFLAAMMKWGYANKNILHQTKFIGGDPYQREVYGYFHEGADESFLILRNPFVAPQSFSFSIRHLFSQKSDSSFFIEELYPANLIYPDLLTDHQDFTINLEGYEVKVLCIRSVKEMKQPLIAGVFTNILAQNSRHLEMQLSVDPLLPACAQIFGEGFIHEIKLNDQNLSANELRRYLCKSGKESPASFIQSVTFSRLDKDQISGNILFDAAGLIQDGRVGVLLDFKSNVENLWVTFPNQTDTSGYLIKKGAEGAWYWILVPLKDGKASFSLDCRDASEIPLPEGTISIWVLGDLKFKAIGTVKIKSKKDMPQESNKIPGDSSVRNITHRLFESKI